MNQKWTEEEDLKLSSLFPAEPKNRILEEMGKDWQAVLRRARRLHLKRLVKDAPAERKTRKDAWSPEEEEMLRHIYEENRKSFIEDKIGRPWKGILARARKLGLHRNPEILKAEMIEGGHKSVDSIENVWTDSETDTMKSSYADTPREYLMERLPGRSWSAIRTKAVHLGVTRNEDLVRKENSRSTLEGVRAKYGVDSYFETEEFKEKSKRTNQEKRGVDYPTQSPEVREKVRKSVQARLGVDNVFQSEAVRDKLKRSLLEKHGVDSPMKSEDIQQKASDTCKVRYGVENPLQLVDSVKDGMKAKYGEEVPLRVPEIMEKKRKTSLERYGFDVASKSPEVRKRISEKLNDPEVKKKKHDAMTANNTFSTSKEELAFYSYLLKIDPGAKPQQMHPILHHVMDFYSPLYNLWIQYDGEYWHGPSGDNPQGKGIRRNTSVDALQISVIKNLLRIRGSEFKYHLKEGSVIQFIEDRLGERASLSSSTEACHQYKKRLEAYTEDLESLAFNPKGLKASDFHLDKEALSDEIRDFISKYEWLGTIGNIPKWCFTARYRDTLSGVVLINEPNKYSKVLGEDTPRYEALIQRGASASWTPKNLGSRLIMFACNWMVQNTDKRAFIGYADPAAGERGVIYRACNFECLEGTFGGTYLYQHASISRLFTRQYLERTASFKKWCRMEGIVPLPSWFKDNGYKDLQSIPEEIVTRWRTWNSKIIRESNKIKNPPKTKFIKVLGKDNRELMLLNKKKTYETRTYTPPKGVAIEDIELARSYKRTFGKTASRKGSSKISFILDNHYKLSRGELASALNETPRWVKRQISALIKEGKIRPKK